MKHRGEILKQKVEDSGKSVAEIAKKLGIHRSTLYRVFEEPFASFDYIVRVGKIINYDFAKDFVELEDPMRQIKEEELGYKLKYFQLLEEHSNALKELLMCRDEVKRLRTA